MICFLLKPTNTDKLKTTIYKHLKDNLHRKIIICSSVCYQWCLLYKLQLAKNKLNQSKVKLYRSVVSRWDKNSRTVKCQSLSQLKRKYHCQLKLLKSKLIPEIIKMMGLLVSELAVMAPKSRFLKRLRQDLLRYLILTVMNKRNKAFSANLTN